MRMGQRFIILTVILMLLVVSLLTPSVNQHAAAGEGVYRTSFDSGDFYLTVEILDDDLAHFEFGTGVAADEAIWTTPMVAKTDYAGPSEIYFPENNVIETSDLRLDIEIETLCIRVTDINRETDLHLTTICPQDDTDLDESVKLSLSQETTTDVYGLGEHFQRRGGSTGNLFGQRRLMLNSYGNELTRFEGGNVGNAQFPIVYALGQDTDNYAVFVDHVYWQFWNFMGDPFTMQTNHAPLRWYVMTGEDLPNLRHDYMELTGYPPPPLKQMFGLWVSEYGYENWEELVADLDALREAEFPVDGFVLDLQWFGGVSAPNGSQMGSLTWDEDNFPDPANMIAALRHDYGLGIMTIEEPYVSTTADGYAEALEQGVLVRECAELDCSAINMNTWWGSGGMVDWTDPDVAGWWHDNRRQHLVEAGVIGHWTDLGEPENFDDRAWYFGFPEFDLHSQADVHNIYNFMWSKSIFEGYARNDTKRRPFILSRSGTSGSQRFGVAMWSGDIAANMNSLATHMNAQMHLSLSGIDYFGSDIGGFYRQSIDPLLDADTMFTIWLANAVLLDVPLRPHALNLQNLYETNPALIGDVESNRANVRLRYELSRYLYTQAQRAYRGGDPIFAPLVYYFQDDPNVRELGSQKMIGSDLMVTTVTSYEIEMIPVYLPAGKWVNYHTRETFESNGEWIDVATDVDGIFRAPLFVRDGSIIPLMRVDEQTLNMLGQRVDGRRADELIVSIFLADEDHYYTLIEDDGETIAYQDGEIRETEISYQAQENGWGVSINPINTIYHGHSDERSIELWVNGVDVPIENVKLNGEDLSRFDDQSEFDAATSGWIWLNETTIIIKTDAMDIDLSLGFVLSTEGIRN